MTIKHLVISGGGSIGFQYLGLLQHLNEKQFWTIDSIESIYATSVGCLLAVILILKYDWDTINKYMIERPWHDVFKLNAKQIIEAYQSKGLYDKKILDSAFKPLLEAKDLCLTITLKELYEYSKIDLHLFTFELNTFKTCELNHETHPDLSLISAIAMSCALPGLFMPICSDNNCYIDGGVMSNYPLSFCLQKNKVPEEILGINYTIQKKNNNISNVITKDSSILDFILGFSINAMNFITNSIPIESIPYEITCDIDESPVSVAYIKKTVYSAEIRKKFIEDGVQIATAFLRNMEQKDDVA